MPMGSITVSPKNLPPKHHFSTTSIFPYISYNFFDNHFLLIKNTVSETLSSNLFILLHFLHTLFRPFSQKSHIFQKSASFIPLFSMILSKHVFVFTKFHANFTIKNTSNFLIFSHQSFTFFAYFSHFLETQF